MDKLSAKQQQEISKGLFVEPTASQTRRLRSQDLFAGAKELVIEHAGDEYRLRLTAQGKLILTK